LVTVQPLLFVFFVATTIVSALEWLGTWRPGQARKAKEVENHVP
jgi:hypothetical protein